MSHDVTGPGRPVLLIAGPTASGKSALALRLARRLGATIVNADSMQVYRDLRILSARPTPEEEGSAPHRLFGHVDASVNHSVGLWIGEARRILDETRGPLIFCGGTGLYFKALTQGLSEIPAVPADVRARTRAEAEGLSPAALHARLATRDPATAERLRPSDPQRILRALEVFAATGRPLASFQGARRPPLLAPGAWRGLFLSPDRDALREAIDRRFVAMMAAGALGEVEALAARRLDAMLPAMRAHGVPPLLAHLRGEMSLEEAIIRARADTRAYARRQFTFARGQLPGFASLPPPEAETWALAVD